MHLLLKNFGERMPEADIREERGALHIRVQAVMQLRSLRRDQEAEKYRPLTPHSMVSVARGPDVAKVRSASQMCCLQGKVETNSASKGPLQCKCC